MYSRSYNGQELNFEASGGLVNSSLVMQDRQTDSYWSIMKGASTAGKLRGTPLVELPDTEKTSWGDWRRRHPDTKVLSVNGREDGRDVYAGYWRDKNGFRGQKAKDRRLKTKTPIFAFRDGNAAYAVAQSKVEGGAMFALENGRRVFLYRPEGAAMFASTAAFASRAGFVQQDGHWIELESGAEFDPSSATFTGDAVQHLGGFDTFWYNWSLNNPDTAVLE